ncbi:MAG: hypothetical protein KTR21_13010 [Rhodobacteraceae bacterium]|nr:hypothetical protein [Paracoccaceae bacterium]
MMNYSDDILRQFLDGALDEAKRKEIETAMLSDADLEARIMGLDDLAAEVKAVMESVPGEARLTGLQPAIAPTPIRAPRPWAMLAAACAVGVFIGFGASFFNADAGADWRKEVAHYQALYTADTIEAIDLPPGEAEAQVNRAAAEVGATVPTEALAALDGLALRRAQVLGFEGAPLAQIVFAHASGAPVALCLIRTGDSEAPQMGERLGMASADWAVDGVEYLLIGNIDADEMAKQAERIRTLIIAANNA